MSNSIDNQFVIQKHCTPDGGHWDLMLQIENTLWTWRLHHPPQHIQDIPIAVEKIQDHSLRFLTYEGSVQNNTAEVNIVDHGNFKIINRTNTDIEFETSGKTLAGNFQLHREQDDIWTLLRIL